MSEVLERVEGRSGELVLRRSGGHLEVILNGAFLISSQNEASSRAMVTAGLEALGADDVRTRPAERGDEVVRAGARVGAGGRSDASVSTPVVPCRLSVLIGGLGLGYALDEALAHPGVAAVTVVEFEPTIVRWFERYGEGRAARAAAAADAARPSAQAICGAHAARAAIVVADVADVLRRAQEAYDLICLDTDNGPGWLVREANAGLYEEAGVLLAHDALRPGGAAVFWSTERYPQFEARLRTAFGSVTAAGAHDVVAGRRHDYVMYVARRVD